jgi:hypothetical protein
MLTIGMGWYGLDGAARGLLAARTHAPARARAPARGLGAPRWALHRSHSFPRTGKCQDQKQRGGLPGRIDLVKLI